MEKQKAQLSSNYLQTDRQTDNSKKMSQFLVNLGIQSSTIGVKNSGDYIILTHASKNTTNNPETAQYRSIVYRNGVDGKPVLMSVAPPSAIDLHGFEKQHPLPLDKNHTIHANEAIEGTMINLFFDHVDQKWEIATKSSIAGEYWFFRTNYFDGDDKPITFREMFIEAMMPNVDMDMANMDAEEDEDPLQKIPLLEILPKDYSYSFVIQHPANHIVLNLTSVAVYLVSVFHVGDHANTNLVEWISPVHYETWPQFSSKYSTIQFPRKYEITSYEDLWSTYCSPESKNHSVGVMIHNLANGERTIMRNHNYVDLRFLRGNHPNMQYKYFELRSQPREMQTFLANFPQYVNMFATFEEQFAEFVQQVHSAYISYYVKKSGARIAKRLFPMIYRMHHEEFLVYRRTMRKELVFQFIEKQKITDLMYYINMNMSEMDQEKIE